MAAVQWVYANGSNWVPLDVTTQQLIEQLWFNNRSAWIDCRTFSGRAYVDFDAMQICFNSLEYTFARRRSS
ncbi:hypothetical protein INT47_009643 [Mucor saturninus]|uniref:WWE domain-containing protein n=1 Tax=Mucor saturninus TaxID=64648 RepID=A0A8H7QQT9_9FUNG|nr:hypothetical protein INT47_009643 [Mucor saturninus]